MGSAEKVCTMIIYKLFIVAKKVYDSEICFGTLRGVPVTLEVLGGVVQR